MRIGTTFCRLHRVAEDALAGAGLAEHDGIDRLEVAGIGGEVDVGLLRPSALRRVVW